LRFLVVGGGSIGKRHLRNLLYLSQEASVVEPAGKRAGEIRKKYNVKVYPALDEALKERYDAAVICSPNIYHIPAALKIAREGVHLFIEKPLSHNLNGVTELVRSVKKKKLHTFMGSNFKFHPSFKLMKKLLDSGRIGRVLSFAVISGQYLPDWHPWEDYRKGYSANKSLGGGILLDSHDFDYIQWFLNPVKRIACLTGKRGGLRIDTEDIAETIAELKDNTIGSVHVDYLQRPYGKKYYFYGEKGTLEWDYREKRVSLYEVGDKKWRYFKEDKNYDLNQMYVEEMKHFLRVLNGKEDSKTDIYTAIQVLKVILSAKESYRSKRFINVA
jgi:predicted dehydrogenase